MIINGNSLEELKKFPDNYFHSVVTDPPYGLSFMGKKWDYDVPSVELWQEVFRVLKEGGYLLSFAGTRTQHRMAVNIEDAGFEIRDMIAWVYGSGFPKSHNIGKAVDKLQGNEREDLGEAPKLGGRTGKNPYQSQDNNFNGEKNKDIITKGTSEWEGWGTALKPALEPITMARKPFKTSVAENVLKNGVGGINIDGCRVGTKPRKTGTKPTLNTRTGSGNTLKGSSKNRQAEWDNENKGRFPANFIHNGSDEVKDLFPYSGGGKRIVGGTPRKKDGHIATGSPDRSNAVMNIGDSGSASRFFYCAKASKKDRSEGLENFEEKESFTMSGGDKKEKVSPNDTNGKTLKKNHHPTVKPTDLMRYLVRLVTPKQGIVLDCFMGSGSTGKACALEGFEFVGIDLDKDYCEIAKARIDKAIEDKKQAEAQTELF